MKRKDQIIILAAVIGAILLTALWRLTGTKAEEQSGRLELEPFESIRLSVMSGDVTVKEGEGWFLEYRLHGREKMERAEVKDGTLYVKTGFDSKWKPDSGSWSAVITVPRGTDFSSVRLSSAAGHIDFSGYRFREGSFSTTSGDIDLSALSCGTLSAESVSGSISLADSEISASASLKTVSGALESTGTPFAGVYAESYGKIIFNGTEQGRRFRLEQGEPQLNASSVSGGITVGTE